MKQPSKWLPECASLRTRPGKAEPVVYFRIVHLALRKDGKNDCERQIVEPSLGPKGAFGNGNTGSLFRRRPKGRAVSAIPPPRGSPRPIREPKTPRVVELLRKAIEWQGLLESGQIPSQAEIARQEGLTRARVTQILSLLNLAPKIQQYILSMPKMSSRPVVTERSLRSITLIEDQRHQIEMFERLAR